MSQAFPRGGSSGTTKLKRGNETGSDDLFGASKRTRRIEVKQEKKKDKKKISTSSVSLSQGVQSSVGLGQTKILAGDRNVMKIEQLTFTKYSTGVLALGYVLNVTSSHAIISLPGGATGTVAYSEISDYCNRMSIGDARGRNNINKNNKNGAASISELLPKNTPVRVYVIGTAAAEDKKTARNKKTLELSCRLSLVNRGIALRHLLVGTTVAATVTSVEDDGYVMTAGIPDVTFFLPSAKISPPTRTLPLGSIRECVVDTVKEASRSVILRAHERSVRDAVTFGSSLAFNNLLPGNLVNVVVDRIVQVR